MSDIGFKDLVKNTDIKKGDIVDVSSDLRRIILYCRKSKEPLSPDELLNSVQEAVSEAGTVLIRTWNWDFCHGIPFDYYKTPSRVGALGNIALRRKDFIRTHHPLYSYAVWGKYSKDLFELNNVSAFGPDSPFGFLTGHHGKQLMLGSTMYNSFTYVHYVEEQTGVSYRFLKPFTCGYTDETGKTEIKTYTMNVRKLELNIKMTSEKFIEDFQNAGALKTWDYGDLSVSTVDLASSYPIVENDILHNCSRKICSYNGQGGA